MLAAAPHGKCEADREKDRTVRQTGEQSIPLSGLVIKSWECFDDDTGKDGAAEVRAYYVPDFSEWKDHDKFEAAFAKLLRDLR